VALHVIVGLNAKSTKDPTAMFRGVGGIGKSMMVLATPSILIPLLS